MGLVVEMIAIKSGQRLRRQRHGANGFCIECVCVCLCVFGLRWRLKIGPMSRDNERAFAPHLSARTICKRGRILGCAYGKRLAKVIKFIPEYCFIMLSCALYVFSSLFGPDDGLFFFVLYRLSTPVLVRHKCQH